MIEVFEQATKLIEEHGYSIHDYLYAVEAYGSSILGLSAKAQEAFNCYYDLLIAGVTDNQKKGELLEKLASSLFNNDLFCVRRNCRTSTNEIDILIDWSEKARLLGLNSAYPFLGELILCECKNYKKSIGVTYIGKFASLLSTTMFFDSKVGIRPSAEEKLEDSIEELFRLRKKQTISPQVFIWRLNLRITGCILDSKKYGWLFYYSQLTDLSILFHLDWFVGHLFSRYGFDRPKDIKRFIRSYHEITKNISRSSYIINADRYSFEEKAEILSEIYNQRNFNKNDALTVDSLFKATMFKEVQRLEYDIQNFS